MSGTERLHDVEVMSFSKLVFVLLVLSVFSVPILVPGALGADGEEVAASAIDRAEESVVSAYEAVLDAEHVGADVSGLLGTLNVGGEYLAEARVWVRLGNFENATRLANLCYEVVEDVNGEAVELKNEAKGLGVSNLAVRMIGSMVGVVSVVFLGFLVWLVFKQRYRRRVLGLRPEVVSNES